MKIKLFVMKKTNRFFETDDEHDNIFYDLRFKLNPKFSFKNIKLQL